MGTKYSSVSISNYNASPPADDGSQVSANQVKWSTVKTKLTDPHNTAVAAINSSLVQAFDVGPTTKSASYTTVAADYNTVLEVTGTTTITLLAASTAGAGYFVTVKNNDTNVVTVASSDNIDGAASVSIPARRSLTFMVDAAAATYFTLDRDGLPSTLGAAGTSLRSTGSDTEWKNGAWETLDTLAIPANTTLVTISDQGFDKGSPIDFIDGFIYRLGYFGVYGDTNDEYMVWNVVEGSVERDGASEYSQIFRGYISSGAINTLNSDAVNTTHGLVSGSAFGTNTTSSQNGWCLFQDLGNTSRVSQSFAESVAANNTGVVSEFTLKSRVRDNGGVNAFQAAELIYITTNGGNDLEGGLLVWERRRIY